MPRKRGRARKKARRPRTDPEARIRALDTVSRMRREGLSLTRAARHAWTTPETVRKYAGRALVKTASGRYAATRSDRLTRRIPILTKDGIARIQVRNSNTASRVGRYMAAVNHYLLHGEAEALAEFHGGSIQANGVTYPFITDPAMIERLHDAGATSFDRFYAPRG